MSQIQYLPVDKLDPHPDNPRQKNLGDLSELAESIKVNGILQNLTVVPWFSGITYAPLDDPAKQADAGWRVVIGHRRLAAAKLAGLTEVPCIISDMELRDQVRTMLMENMQREDLTAYEQAQGFQMMMNLGDSVDDIASKTGFSESTVRRRVKLLELDADKFKESAARGASMWEYVELEKIKDIEKRNEVLDKVGTDNFKYELKRAIDNQTSAERRAAVIARLSEFATQVDERGDYASVCSYYPSEGPEKIETPEDADSTDYFFCVSSYWIQLLKERVDEDPDDEARAQREAAEAAKRERLAQLEEIAKRAYALRWDFVKSVSTTVIKKNLASIIAASVWQQTNSGYITFDEDEFCDLLKIDRPDSDGDDYDSETERMRFAEAIAAAPERALFYEAYCNFEDGEGTTYYQRWRGAHEENRSLDHLYELLEKLGYRMSDEEKAMRDGTHELFGQSEGSDDARE